MSHLQHLVPGGEHDLSWLQVQRATPSWNRKIRFVDSARVSGSVSTVFRFDVDPKPDPDPDVTLGQIRNFTNLSVPQKKDCSKTFSIVKYKLKEICVLS